MLYPRHIDKESLEQSLGGKDNLTNGQIFKIQKRKIRNNNDDVFYEYLGKVNIKKPFLLPTDLNFSLDDGDTYLGVITDRETITTKDVYSGHHLVAGTVDAVNAQKMCYLKDNELENYKHLDLRNYKTRNFFKIYDKEGVKKITGERLIEPVMLQKEMFSALFGKKGGKRSKKKRNRKRIIKKSKKKTR